jgi:hypothetical protein
MTLTKICLHWSAGASYPCDVDTKAYHFLVDKDVIKCNIIEDSYSIQFSNNFKKFSVISDILINKDDEVQGKIQNQTIPILKNTDLRLIKDLYDIEIVNIPIKKQLLIEPDIYDFKSYILSLFNLSFYFIVMLHI